MTRARLSLIAGLTSIAGMMAADASAQDCPGWLQWVCADKVDSSWARGASRDNQLSRTRVPSSSEVSRKTNQTKPAADSATKPEQRAKLNGDTHNGSQRFARYRERQETRLSAAMSDQEKTALFEEFLAWQKAHR
jgi:hypothetical protein